MKYYFSTKSFSYNFTAIFIGEKKSKKYLYKLLKYQNKTKQ